MLERAVFLDRDNTIIENDGFLGDPGKVKLLPGAATALASLRALGYRLIVVSNQSGVARGMFTEDAVESVNKEMGRQLKEQAQAYVDASYYCPYHPEAPVAEYRLDHDWRKPKPGMLKQAAVDFNLDLSLSWMIGDQERDIAAGAAAGCRTILLKSPDVAAATEPDKGSGAGGLAVSPNFIVHSLADAARIIVRERRVSAVQPAPSNGKDARKEAPVPAEPKKDTATNTAIAPGETNLVERVAEKVTRQLATQPQPPAAGGAAHVASSKLERQLDDLIVQLRQQNRNAELQPETRFDTIIALILQILVVAALAVGVHTYFTRPMSFTPQSTWPDFMMAGYARLEALFWGVIAMVLQGIVIALLLRARSK